MNLKEQILGALLSGREISGEELARRFFVSRNAVWKAVGQLRREGYEISAGTNRGYRLSAFGDRLSEAVLRHALGGERQIVFYPEIGSTNTEAKRLAEAGAPEGTLVVADMQSEGRGRRGRSFISPAGKGLYMSVILRPSAMAADAACLTAFAAVATAEAIEALVPLSVGIKWVNDLFLKGRKVAGILSEASLDLESGGLSYAVIGIGINVQSGGIPPELSEIAISLEEASGQRIDRAALCAGIVRGLEGAEAALAGGLYLPEYRRRSTVIGRRVTVLRGGEEYSATVLGIDDRAGLIVRTDEGEECVLSSGEISVRVKA